jgi:topoisomerase IA-like protein
MNIKYILFFINRYNFYNKELTFIHLGKNNANLDYDDYNTTVRIKYYNQLIKERKERERKQLDW